MRNTTAGPLQTAVRGVPLLAAVLACGVLLLPAAPRAWAQEAEPAAGDAIDASVKDATAATSVAQPEVSYLEWVLDAMGWH
ncbi:MAG TPA: hypothetical protein PJ982_12140, partial [Lacipirellulaceae bacterium]|nr:hypothetical protein [Lacipirellulaceae bacterium]